jgi:hypothetical protein
VSTPKSEAEPPQRIGLRRFVSAAFFGLALLSLAQFAGDSRWRDRAEQFAGRFRLEERGSFDLSMMRLVSSGDLSAAIVVDVALRDSDTKPLVAPRGEPRPEDPQRKLPSPRKDELDAARSMMIDAMAARPGWAYHRFLIGKAAFLASRDSTSAPPPRPELWVRPLQSAAQNAPSVDVIWETLASDCLESWDSLTAALRNESPAVFRRALLDPEFVARSLVPISLVLGRDETIRLLPDAPKTLETAAKEMARAGDIDAAAILTTRRETEERKQRVTDLKLIEQRAALRDEDGLERACALWAWDHPLGEFDDPLGRSQSARVLELWPNERLGSWRGDARAQLVRYFLAGRESDVPPRALARALEPLSGVPASVAARVRLLQGDVDGANDLSQDAAAEGALEWTPYYLTLSRYELSQGKPALARAALSRVAPGTREECEVLIARRDVGRALDDPRETQSAQEALERLRNAFDPQQAWSSKGTLSVCIDPERASAGVLTVDFVAEKPAIIGYGWDGGRLGTLFVRDGGTLSVPFQGLSGRRTFSIETILGGRVHVSRTAIGPRS